MKLNLNRFSGIMMLFFFGASCASFPPSFILRGNHDEIGGLVFMILGGSFLIIGAIFLIINAGEAKKNKSDLSESKKMQLILGLLALTVLTMLVMYILGEYVRFY